MTYPGETQYHTMQEPDKCLDTNREMNTSSFERAQQQVNESVNQTFYIKETYMGNVLLAEI